MKILENLLHKGGFKLLFVCAVFVLSAIFAARFIELDFLLAGGDIIPNLFIYEYVSNNFIGEFKNFGIPGHTVNFSYLSYVPLTYLLSFFARSDILYLLFFVSLSITGYYFLFKQTFHLSKVINMVSSFFLVSNVYFWMFFYRNIFFLNVLFAFLPWLILAIRTLLDHDFNWRKLKDYFPWFIFLLLGSISSVGLMNPGYAIPAIIFTMVYLLIFTDLRSKHKKLLGIIVLSLVFSLPNLIGQINQLVFNNALQDDYWNNVILTKNALENQKVNNIISNILKGYSSESINNYGMLYGKPYYPWWFAPHKDGLLSILLYAPFFLAIFLSTLAYSYKNNDKYKILSLLSFLAFLIFMLKSSAEPFGQIFYDFMMSSGWPKIFRSPHLKFGFEFSLTLLLIILLCLKNLRSKHMNYFTIFFMVAYITVFGLYPVLTGQYIPPLQRVKAIPQEYFDLKYFIVSHNNFSKENDSRVWDLGILMPPNESTWDSNNWGQDGFYEGYHILHWMNTGVSFLNRNGLSFNKNNIIGFEAWMKLGNNNIFNPNALDVLRSQGYDIIVYDKSSDRESRFGIKENHEKNVIWLNSQSDKIEKTWEEGSLILYVFKNSK